MPYPVTTRANLLSGIYADPFLIRNAGSVDILLGQDSSLMPGNQALTLSPGSTFQWQGRTELWAVTVSGESMLEIMRDAGSVFTPAPANVNLNPGATVGLDPSTTVGLNPGSSVNVGNTVGVTGSVNVTSTADPLFSVTSTLTSTGTTYTYVTDYNVEAFNTVVLLFASPTYNGALTFPDMGYQIDVTWSAIKAGVSNTPLYTERIYNSSRGRVSVTLPVQGNRMTIRVTPIQGSTLPYDVSVIATGLKIVLPKFYSHKWNYGGNGYSSAWSPASNGYLTLGENSIFVDGYVTRGSSNPGRAFVAIDTVAGLGTLTSMRINEGTNVATNDSFQWSIESSLGQIWSAGDTILSFPAGFDFTVRNQPVTFPRAPMYYDFALFSGSATANLRVRTYLQLTGQF